MTHFSIVLKNPSAVRDLAINYAKVAKAVGDDQGYEFFEILREKVEEAQYVLSMKAREEEEVNLPKGWSESNFQTLEEQGWRSPKDFPRYVVSRTAEVFDIQEHRLLKKKPCHSYKMINEFNKVCWFTPGYLLKRTWPELVED
jgi:hypothetical protein